MLEHLDPAGRVHTFSRFDRESEAGRQGVGAVLFLAHFSLWSTRYPFEEPREENVKEDAVKKKKRQRVLGV